MHEVGCRSQGTGCTMLAVRTTSETISGHGQWRQCGCAAISCAPQQVQQGGGRKERRAAARTRCCVVGCGHSWKRAAGGMQVGSKGAQGTGRAVHSKVVAGWADVDKHRAFKMLQPHVLSGCVLSKIKARTGKYGASQAGRFALSTGWSRVWAGATASPANAHDLCCAAAASAAGGDGGP